MIKDNNKEEVLEVEVEEVKEEQKTQEKENSEPKSKEGSTVNSSANETKKGGDEPSVSPTFYKEMTELLKMNQAQQAELNKLIKAQNEQIKKQQEELSLLKQSIPTIEYDQTAHIEGRFDFNHISRDLINEKTKTEKEQTFLSFQQLKSIFR